MAEGWTPVFDRLFDPDHELAGDVANRRWAWVDLCHMARYHGGVKMIGPEAVPLKRGEFLASIRYLANRWRWSKDKVRRYLAALAHPTRAKIATVRETRNGTVYRIVTYDTWRNVCDTKRDAERDADGTATGHRRDTDGTKKNMVTREHVTTSADAEVVASAPQATHVLEHLTPQARDAWDRLTNRMRNPGAVAAECEAIVTGMHKTQGPTPTWDAISAALVDMEIAGARVTGNAIRGFARKAMEAQRDNGGAAARFWEGADE